MTKPDLNPLLRAAASLPLARATVTACIDVAERPYDATFAAAFSGTLASLEPAARTGALAGVTGHIAESVAEMLLVELGWTPVWHFIGPGRHGVDLLMLDPNLDRLFALEVKGTLRPGHWPRLRRLELTQMDIAWLDKADNPAMAEWGLRSADLYGAIVLVNFHDLAYKVALTSDFHDWRPITASAELEDISL